MESTTVTLSDKALATIRAALTREHDRLSLEVFAEERALTAVTRPRREKAERALPVYRARLEEVRVALRAVDVNVA